MSVTWILAAGGTFAILAAAARGGARALRAALAVAVALGTSGTVMSVALLAGARPGPAARIAVGSALAAAALAFAAYRGLRGAPAERVPGWLWAVLAAAVALAALAVARRVAAEPEGGWDAFMIWNLRARMLHALAPGVRGAFPPEVVTSQPDYPVLLPSLIVQGWTLAGAATSRVPLALSLGVAVLAAAALTAAVAAVRGPRAALLAAALLATTPAFVAAAGAQYADQLVALFLVASAAATWVGLEQGGAARWLALAGLLASFAAWTKNEGALLAIALALGVAFSEGARLRGAAARPLVACAAGAAPVLALSTWFRVAIAPRNAFLHDPLRVQLARAVDPARVAAALASVARRLVYFQGFGLHVAAAVVVLVLLARRGALARPAPRAIAIALGVAWSGILATYVVSPFDVGWLVQHSADRLILQDWPCLLFLLFAASRPRAAAAGPGQAGAAGSAAFSAASRTCP